jgi:hypothetical protein
MEWFEVDKVGLGKLLERRGKEFILYELLQNAWDEDSTEVRVILRKLPQRGRASIAVQDDSPNGFADLSHAFTLFAESAKKSDPTKRGRFNIGEKLVLALCEEASIKTTTGTIIFDAKGRRTSREKTESGTLFGGVLKMTAPEVEACFEAVTKVIPPQDIRKSTYFNGQRLASPKLVGTTQVSLATEVSDDEGRLVPATRLTGVKIYEPREGEVGTLYEMGIPIVETGDRWHANVMQKVPLTLDRDNVKPAYLSKVRYVVAERMARELTEDDANSPWVKDATTRYGSVMSSELVRDIARLRFGDKRVSFDPSDPEANSLAVSKGYTVVHGRSMSKPEWEAMRRVDAILPAGQVTPSPKPFHPDGEPLVTIPKKEWSEPIANFARYAERLAFELMGVKAVVTIANDFNWHFNGAYGKGGDLTVNVARVGYKWFEGSIARVNEFLIHEFGHEYSDDHLSSEYHDALCRLGGDLSQLILDKPLLFKERGFAWETK